MKWKTLPNALADGRPVKINPFGDVFEIAHKCSHLSCRFPRRERWAYDDNQLNAAWSGDFRMS